MNLLVIGSGAREHSIIKQLNNSKIKIFCIGDNQNPGILKITSYIYDYSYLKEENLVTFCKINRIDMAVIGPEKILEKGIVDILEKNSVRCVGPFKSLAKIETDKYYTRNLLKQNHLNHFNPKYMHFTSLEKHNEIESYYQFCKELNFNYVIKPTGLTSGKGVKVSGLHFNSDLEGFLYSLEILKNNQTVLIEEKLIGKEFTLMSYSDGINTSDMPVVVDFKLLETGNKGPNTGSMGCITYSNHLAPFLSKQDVNKASSLNKSIVNILKKDTIRYKGIIYGSYIKCINGDIKLIEFNARYGDPESINVLELLETSLLEIFKSIINGNIDTLDIRYKNTNIISKYLVPDRYPCTSETHQIDCVWYDNNHNSIIASSINKTERGLFSTSSRTLVLFKIGDKIEEMSKDINRILTIPYFRFREDIGQTSVTYKESGVDINLSTEIVNSMKPFIERTLNNNCIHKQGDYSGIIKIPSNYKNPVLISSIDGVGSKPSFLYKYNSDAYKIAGQDIVAHSINDILVKGADPLYFLDYIACEKLNRQHILDIVEGMSYVCHEYNVSLVGGETAEMPRIYNKDEIDIAGCITGISEKENIINGHERINSGDHVIGLYSNGLHTNGFSLLRSIFKNTEPSKKFIKWVSQPHTCYYNELKLLSDITINALVHITGGGLIDNPPRVLPDKLSMSIYKENLMNQHFYYLQKLSGISDLEMYRTFNCGIGMMIVLDEQNYRNAVDIFRGNHIPFCRLGYISNRIGKPVNFI